MHDIAFVDETFDPGQTFHYNLSLRLAHGSFALCAFDPERGKFILLKDYRFDTDLLHDQYISKIKDILREDRFLHHEYRRIRLMINIYRTTLVPESVFAQERVKDLFTFNHDLQDIEELHYNLISPAKAYCIFPFDSDISNLVFRNFQGISLYSHSAVFLQNLLLDHEPTRQSLMALLVGPEHFDLAVIREGQLLLHNIFAYRNDQDMLYFVLNAMDQLELDPDKTPLVLHGEIQKRAPVADLLRQYFRKLKFTGPSMNSSFSGTLTGVEPHIFANLMNLERCE